MREKIIFNAEQIAQIIADTEEIQTSNESAYTKEQAKVWAYNKILELVKTEKVIKMRRPTPEEIESINKYVKSISKATGIDFWALEQEPSGDLISREAVVDAIADTIVYGESLGYGLAEEIVSEIPPIKPQVKTGHWIELGCVGNDNYNFECSECHHTDTQSKAVKVNYCWYCGARMFEPQESEMTE